MYMHVCCVHINTCKHACDSCLFSTLNTFTVFELLEVLCSYSFYRVIMIVHYAQIVVQIDNKQSCSYIILYQP